MVIEYRCTTRALAAASGWCLYFVRFGSGREEAYALQLVWNGSSFTREASPVTFDERKKPAGQDAPPACRERCHGKALLSGV